MECKDVLALFDVKQLLSEIAFVAGEIKIILISFISSGNRERFSVDRFFIDEMISENSSFRISEVIPAETLMQKH